VLSKPIKQLFNQILSMHSTSVSLLQRLRGPEEQEASWKRFVQLYTPLLFHWARKLGLSAEDAADLVQEVLILLMRKLPEFDYDPQRSFRGWLRTVTHNKWRDYQRLRRVPLDGGAADLSNLEAAADTAFDEVEYRQHVVKQALDLMQAEFQPATWKACWEYMIVGRSAEEVSKELGLTINAVYLAKSRVLSRLREELAGLLD
jgi:RNA polymerase sigma-70 factor (ECF subfamily)